MGRLMDYGWLFFDGWTVRGNAHTGSEARDFSNSIDISCQLCGCWWGRYFLILLEFWHDVYANKVLFCWTWGYIFGTVLDFWRGSRWARTAGAGGRTTSKMVWLEQVQEQVENLKKKQAEDTVDAAKGQVRALAAYSSSTDSVVLAVDNLIEVATCYGHPDAILFRP